MKRIIDVFASTSFRNNDDVEARYSFRVCFSNPGDCKKIHQKLQV